MTILLLGGGGQLGRTFVEEGGLASLDRLVVATRSGSLDDKPCAQADLADPTSLQVLLEWVAPSIVVNAAAYTAVDAAEDEEALATRINGDAVGLLGRWAARRGALVVHYSTDYVFDGAATTPYAVDALTAPLGAYGRSKRMGEQALAESGSAHLIFRTSWVYAPHGKNFLTTMLRLGAERDELQVVDDQIGAPTSTALLVRCSLEALDVWLSAAPAGRRQLEGIHHLVPDGQTSWYGFARAILEHTLDMGLIAKMPSLIPVTTAEYYAPAKRPQYSVLDNRRFTRIFKIVLPSWQHELTAVMQRLNPKLA